ncbi:hypothetical protein C5167_041304 [Papaver somniferum]|uniref:MATH domain-containing protein n=1 Tax=Papaver somniferum TaxID=3469 RepID=A0A4Y7IKW6_PAPSO|nr:ubiquitin carboxyl-terminal hydrolase 12-like [Papaver somniferum]RZC48371.1 hypothetical protein C5167_041304 [Papaver somniferum]
MALVTYNHREIAVSSSNSIKNVTHTTRFTWEIPNFSRSNVRQGHQSEVFSVGGHKWKLGAYGDKDNNKLSVFLLRADSTNNMPYVEYKFTVMSTNERNNVIRVSNHQYTRRDPHRRLGYDPLMPLLDFFDPAKGYIIRNTCTIRVEISCRG